MAASTLYPRANVKKQLKAHSNRPLSKNVDILVFLNYTLFMQDLIKEARIDAKANGEKGVTARSIRKVREGCLRRAKS